MSTIPQYFVAKYVMLNTLNETWNYNLRRFNEIKIR
jgi:hypothetical protein